MHIQNFLSIDDAVKIYALVDIISPEKWQYVFSTDNGNVVYYDETPENSDVINAEIIRTETNFLNENPYGFRFRRIFQFESPILLKILDFINTELKNSLCKSVGCTDIEIITPFLSKYEDGDFALIHDDADRGEYSFTFQLTKDWNPHFGGFLSFWDKENRSVTETFYPDFNSVTIFKLEPENNPLHFVNKVVGPKSRIAITGWFKILSR